MRPSSLLWRALWWRRGFSLALLVVATITAASAALGPLYARAAAQSVLADRLTSAPPGQAGLEFAGSISFSDFGALDDVAKEVPAPGTIPGFPARIVSAYFPLSATGVTDQPSEATEVVDRPGACAHLILVQGRCPAGRNEIAISDRTASAGPADAWQLGGSVHFGDPNLAAGASTVPASLPAGTVVGIYRPRDINDQFWFGHNYFDAHLGAGDASSTVDDVFTGTDGALALSQGLPGTVLIDYPPDPSRIRLQDLPKVTAAVQALEQTFGRGAALDFTGTDLRLHTGFDQIVAAQAAERRLLDAGSLLVTVQLTVLALLVLFQVMSEAVEARGNEIALAKLRGLRAAATVRFGLAEPLTLLVLGLPLGLGVSYLTARLLASAALAPGTPVTITVPVLYALGAALIGGVVATGVAARRTLTRPVLEQWRRTSSSARPRRLAFALDLLVAAAAVAGLVVLLSRPQHGHPGSAALLAPALLIFAVALVGVRLIPRLSRSLTRPTRAGRGVGLFLAVRQLSRRPGPLRLAALLAVAVGLATFAIAGESVAVSNRTARAQAELGAPTVLSVQLAAGHDPVTVTQAVDPQGRWAMAAADWLPAGGFSVSGTVLGVDADRFAAVSYPVRRGVAPAELTRQIVGSAQPAVTLRGTRVTVTVTASGLSGENVPTVTVDLRLADNSVTGLPLGAMRPGTHDYTGALPCPTGCRLEGLTWAVPSGVSIPVGGRAVVAAVAVDGAAVDVGLTRAGAWRGASQNPGATDALGISASGLSDSFAMMDGQSAGLRYADVPAVLPVVATAGAINYLNGAMTDTVDVTAMYTTRTVAALLPNVLDDGVIGNLSYLRASLPGFDSESAWQVWLGPQAPSDAVAQLTKAGLLVQSASTEHTRVVSLGRQGPALALLLLLATAIAGAVLSVGGTAIAVTASGRRRSFELAALRVVGVPRAALLRSSILEQVILLGAGVVLGLPTGWIAARLTMPSIAQFADPTPVALRYVPAPGSVLLFGAAFVVLLAVTAVLAGRSLVALAVPSRLREAEA